MVSVTGAVAISVEEGQDHHIGSPITGAIWNTSYVLFLVLRVGGRGRWWLQDVLTQGNASSCIFLLLAIFHTWDSKKVSNVDFHFLGEVNGGANTESIEEYLY